MLRTKRRRFCGICANDADATRRSDSAETDARFSHDYETQWKPLRRMANGERPVECCASFSQNVVLLDAVAEISDKGSLHDENMQNILRHKNGNASWRPRGRKNIINLVFSLVLDRTTCAIEPTPPLASLIRHGVVLLRIVNCN